jgi:spore coat polysaccharide biosynthesis predicted glycosyltransferase SpsG
MILKKYNKIAMYKVVALKVDYDESVGYGHLFRMVNLSKYLLKNNFKIILITSSLNKIKNILSKRIILENTTDNFYGTLNILKKYNCNTLISDISHKRNLSKKNFFLRYNSFFKKKNIKTISFDDPRQFCSSNFSIIPYPCKSIRIKKLKNTKIYKGIEYAIVPENLEKIRRKKFNKSAKNILVILGGAPSEKLLKNIIISITNIEFPDIIAKVFIGNIQKNSFYPLLKNKKKFILFSKFKSIKNLLSWSDFVIMGEGLLRFEVIASGRPGFYINNLKQNSSNIKLIKEFNSLNLLQFIEISDLKKHKIIAKELENYMMSKKKIFSNLYNSSKIKFNKSLNLIEKNI